MPEARLKHHSKWVATLTKSNLKYLSQND